jgi:hypothetical protein
MKENEKGGTLSSGHSKYTQQNWKKKAIERNKIIKRQNQRLTEL